MRGEVLSSVELVLPPNVVETCYNLKRDVQARFRAVNSEERTKSEITVEKQPDDSVRIHVLVISLSRLGSREFCTEEAPGTTVDEEDQDLSPVRSKKVPHKRGRQARNITRHTQQEHEDDSRLDETESELIDKPSVDTGKPSIDTLEETSAQPGSSELDSATTDAIVKSPLKRGRPARKKSKALSEDTDNLPCSESTHNIADDKQNKSEETEKLGNVEGQTTETPKPKTAQGVAGSSGPGRQVGRKGRGRGVRKLTKENRPGLGSNTQIPTRGEQGQSDTGDIHGDSNQTSRRPQHCHSAQRENTEQQKLLLKETKEQDIKTQNLNTQSNPQALAAKDKTDNLEDVVTSDTLNQTGETSANHKQSEGEKQDNKTCIQPKGRRGRKASPDELALASSCEVRERESPISTRRGRKKATSEGEELKEITSPDSVRKKSDEGEVLPEEERLHTQRKLLDNRSNTETLLTGSDIQSNQVTAPRKKGALNRLGQESQESVPAVEATAVQPKKKGKVGLPPSTEPKSTVVGSSDQLAPSPSQVPARRGRPPGSGKKQLAEARTKAAKKEEAVSGESLEGSGRGKSGVEDSTSTVSHDNASIQNEIKAIDPSQASTEAAEAVVAGTKAAGRKRGRQCTNSGRESSVESFRTAEEKGLQASPVPQPPEQHQPQQRVKTKAQLKQKPSELSDKETLVATGQPKELQDLHLKNVIREDHKPRQDTEAKEQAKPAVKKHPKPKTLARIWRSRKRHLFTHRKQRSKAKTVAAEPATRGDLIDQDIHEECAYSKESTSETFLSKTETDITEVKHEVKGEEDEKDGEEGSRRSSPKRKVVVRQRCNITEESTSGPTSVKLNDVSKPSQGTTEIDSLKLPQKKRHTAKLAAEKAKADRERESLLAKGLPAEAQKDENDIIATNPESAAVQAVRIQETTEGPTPPPQLEIEADRPQDKHETVGKAELNGLSVSEPPQLELFTEPLTQDNSPDPASRKENTEDCDLDPADAATPRSAEVIRQLMRIATGPKTEDPISPPSQRQGKRAYKREFKVQCRFCQVKVKDYGYLFRHVKKLHRNKGAEMQRHLEEIRPLMRTPCPICHKMVSSISNISSHIKQCHASKDSAVLCPICKKTYKTTVSLRQHLRQCHQPQQQRFFCNLCSANFTEKRSLKEHINCSHETTQVFQCDECGKSFLTKGRLRRHKYIHGAFRHKCTYCGKGFHLKDNMNKHIEIVHEKTQGKRFGCPHCEKRFTVKGNMTQHVMGVHLKQFQYTCPQCHTGFRRKKDMLTHMLKHGGVQGDMDLGSDTSSVAHGSLNGQTSSGNKTDGDSDGSWQGEDMLAVAGISSSETKPDTVNIDVQQLELLLPAPRDSNT